MDKMLHAFVSFVITMFFGVIAFLSGGGLAGGLVAGLGSGLGAGFGKEFGDSSNGGKWDWMDIAADGVGVALGLVVVLALLFAKG